MCPVQLLVQVNTQVLLRTPWIMEGSVQTLHKPFFIPRFDLEVVPLELVYKVLSSQPQRTSAGDRHCKCVVTQVCSVEGGDERSQDCSLRDPSTADDSFRHKVLWCHMMMTICEVVLCQGSNWCSNMVWHNIRSSYSPFLCYKEEGAAVSVRIIQAHAWQQGLQVRLLC